MSIGSPASCITGACPAFSFVELTVSALICEGWCQCGIFFLLKTVIEKWEIFMT